MHRPITLAGDEQLVAMECHVHGLAAHLDCRLLAKRRVDETDRVTLETGDSDMRIVRAVTGNLRALCNAFQAHGMGNAVGRGVDQKEIRLLVIDGNHDATIG